MGQLAHYLVIFFEIAIGFAIIMTHLNLSGKTQLSQFTPIDFIGNFILGGVIGGVLYSDSIPVYQFIITLSMGVFIISFLNWLSKKLPYFRRFSIGETIVIIKDGKLMVENIKDKRNKIDVLSLASMMYSQGVFSFQQVKYAQIEPSGTLTLICEDDLKPSIILIRDGQLFKNELEKIEKNEAWLESKLDNVNIKIEDIFFAEYWQGELTIATNEGKIKKNIK